MVRFASLWSYAQINHTVAGDAYIITSRGQYAESSRLQSLMLPLSIDSLGLERSHNICMPTTLLSGFSPHAHPGQRQATARYSLKQFRL
jgi:hypothetical protein